MENKSLISIVKDFNALDELLIESGGELNETLEQWLQINESNLAEKVDNYKLYLDHLDARNEYFKGIKDQANSAQNIFKNMATRLKENLKFAMETTKSDEFRGQMFRYKLSKPKSKIVINDQEAIPMNFMQEKTVFVPDMEKIEAALANGEIIDGVSIETSQSGRWYANTKGKE